MIKVIKEVKKAVPVLKQYRITCKECHSIFECDETDIKGQITVCHGMCADAIRCPICGEVNYDWMGGSDSWEWLNPDHKFGEIPQD